MYYNEDRWDEKEEPWEKIKPCLHPEHDPPQHMVVHKPFIHECPACGRKVYVNPPLKGFLCVK